MGTYRYGHSCAISAQIHPIRGFAVNELHQKARDAITQQLLHSSYYTPRPDLSSKRTPLRHTDYFSSRDIECAHFCDHGPPW